MLDDDRLEELNRKADLVLAELRRQGERITSLEVVAAHVVQAVNGLTAPVASLSEAVNRLATAANKEGGGKLSRTLQGMLDELGKHTGHLAVLAEGVERWPALAEDIAIQAAQLASGGGAGPRPEIEVPEMETPSRP